MTQRQQLDCMTEGFKRVIRSFRDELSPELIKTISEKLNNTFDDCITPKKVSRRKDKLLATSKLPLHEDRVYTLKVMALANRLLITIHSKTYQIHKPQDYKDLQLNEWTTTKLTIERYQSKGTHSNRIHGRLHKHG